MTDRVKRMIRMLERQPPAVQEEISLRVLSELVQRELSEAVTPRGIAA